MVIQYYGYNCIYPLKMLCKEENSQHADLNIWSINAVFNFSQLSIKGNNS